MLGNANTAFCCSAVHPVGHVLTGSPLDPPHSVSSVGAERSRVLNAGACKGQCGKSEPHQCRLLLLPPYYLRLTGFLQLLQVLAEGKTAEGSSSVPSSPLSPHSLSAGASATAETSHTSADA